MGINFCVQDIFVLDPSNTAKIIELYQTVYSQLRLLTDNYDQLIGSFSPFTQHQYISIINLKVPCLFISLQAFQNWTQPMTHKKQ